MQLSLLSEVFKPLKRLQLTIKVSDLIVGRYFSLLYFKCATKNPGHIDAVPTALLSL